MSSIRNHRYLDLNPVDALNKSLEEFEKDEEVIALIKQQERDYQISLTGKLPSFNCAIPESLTGDTFLNIQNQITKSIV